MEDTPEKATIFVVEVGYDAELSQLIGVQNKETLKEAEDHAVSALASNGYKNVRVLTSSEVPIGDIDDYIESYVALKEGQEKKALN